MHALARRSPQYRRPLVSGAAADARSEPGAVSRDRPSAAPQPQVGAVPARAVGPGVREPPDQCHSARWGFRHPAYFSRIFREALGQSPSEFPFEN
ncbi:AraC family transcriptional regulator [Arthrobacter sp. NPDC055138]